jgi:hypothetical protein
LILIPLTIITPFLLPLTFSILLTLVFVISGSLLFDRWTHIIISDEFNIGDMKVPTFYSFYSTSKDGDIIAYILLMSTVGVVFGGIHCVGWFFNFPSSTEAMLWRVSSAVLTGIAFLLPLVITFLVVSFYDVPQLFRFGNYVLTILLQVYVLSRFLLIVEAFISLRHLTPGMLTLVKWTSFIPHI